MPHRVKLDHDVDFVANGVANFFERNQRRFEIFGGDVGPVGPFRGMIKRPYLHGRDPFAQELSRQFVGAIEKAVEIVIRAVAGGCAVVRGRLADCLAHVRCAGAGVVGADFRARKSAKKLCEGLPGDLPEDIPKRDVERRIAAHFGAGGAKPQIADEVFRNPVDLERIAAKQLLRQAFVDIGLDGLGEKEGFAEADDPFRGVHLEPQQVGEFGDADRFEGGDLHRRLKSRRRREAP